MATYSHHSYTIFEPSLSQDGSWHGSAPMQRTESQATDSTTESSGTTSSGTLASHGLQSLFSEDPSEFFTSHDSSPSWYTWSSSEPQDPSQLLSSTGSQDQLSSQQLPQALQLSNPWLFHREVGSIEEAARQATGYANSLILSQQPLRGDWPSVVTSEAVEVALQKLREQGLDASPRAAVQDVLHQELHRRFNNTDQTHTDTSKILEEAAYQLQLRLQGPEVSEICYYAILSVLAGLATDLENDYWGLMSAPADPSSYSPVVSPSSSFSWPPAEKERFPCLIGGCKQSFSRTADLDRHYKMVHLDDSKKKKLMCDYKKCRRHTNPFYRQDHFRDHLRIYHKEDLLRRGNTEEPEWWASRSHRAMFAGWWRCNRCLVVRVRQDAHGFVCPGCGHPCEPERKAFREKFASTQLQL
ncbi:hypothetical protein VTK56DRAFT_6261 [Thermocarpiscus australiensis]